MEDRTRISDIDFVYISFKEPNKEENWADLLSKVPWAKRVDGVVGFDSAHKAAAEKAETDFFISVDGDNIIDEKFLLQTLDWTKTDKKAVHRWRARNNINGLVYGNGGLVGWSKDTCLNMKTHENAIVQENEIDFCWGVPHENLHNCYSTTVINASPQQAFVAGFREGVKMSTEKGVAIPPEQFMRKIWPANLKILTTWMTIGADTDNGKFAMLGARMGCYFTWTEDEGSIKAIRDLSKMANYFADTINIKNLDQDLELYGNSIRQGLGLPIADYDDGQSSFFKFVMPSHINRGVQDREVK
ncbi:MAG: hypothetical protein CBD74_09010 [Saprospirales bacterium TMED214]|nr:MAG: hypothetical protein CBD74_09010 [Saprospirales bacterium TMED214]